MRASSAKLNSSSRPPEIYIEQARADGQELLSGGSRSLPPGTSHIEFRYTGLDFLAPRGIHFRYRLKGIDESWVDAGLHRVAQYTNLPPGRYVFEVGAINAAGTNSQNVADFGFVILPHWYQILPARLVFLLLVSVGLFGLHRLRIGRLQDSERTLTARVDERTRALHGEIAEHLRTADRLQQEVIDHRRAEQEVRSLNTQLENRVVECTAELAQASREALTEKERLAVTLRSIGDAVIATDVRAGVTLMNQVAEELIGWTASEATGRSLDEIYRLVLLNDRRVVANPARQAIEEGRVVNLPRGEDI